VSAPMPIEPAVLLTVEFGSVFFLLQLLPLAYVIYKLPAIWRENRGLALVIVGVVLFTGLLFLLFFTAFITIMFVTGATGI